VWRAMKAVSAGHIPPVGWIDSPDWFSIYDPTTTSTVPVTGHVEARRSPSYTWRLQFAPGAEPTDTAFVTAGSGAGSAPFDGSLSGAELPGWPAHTDPTVVTKPHAGIDPGFEPIVSNVAVGDLAGKGFLKVVVTTTRGTVYVFNDNGKRKNSWTPKALSQGAV